MSRDRRDPPVGRRDEDRRAWELLVGQVRELREDLGELREDVGTLAAWMHTVKDSAEKAGRAVIDRRNAVALWVGVTTGIGGLALAIAAFVHG